MLSAIGVELSCMTRIGVIDQGRAKIVSEILAEAGLNLPVEVKTAWYF
jgi:hypothetical protein